VRQILALSQFPIHQDGNELLRALGQDPFVVHSPATTALTVAEPGRGVRFPARDVTLHAELRHLMRVLLRDLVGESISSYLNMANQRIVWQSFYRKKLTLQLNMACSFA
jgi:hypothetical protein